MDLKEEPDLKSRCCFTLFEPAMPGSWICLNMSQCPNVPIYWNMSQCGKICLDICSFVNMPKHVWNITCLNIPGSWICLNKVQNMHEWLLRSVWNWLNISTILNIPEYTLICLIVPGFWIFLNLPKYTQCGQIYLNISNVVNVNEYVWNITCLNKPGF